jgi:hypothetical protein
LCPDPTSREHLFDRRGGAGSTEAVGDVAEKTMDVRFGGGLDVVPGRADGWLLVTTPQGRRPVAIRVDETEHRCRLGLSLFGGDRIVDVSRDPAAFFNALRSAADLAGEPKERWASAASSGLDRLGRERGWWEERRAGPSEHTALAAAWPLLRQSDLEGDRPAVVPRWVAALCAGPDLRSAVRRELGDRGSRRVTRLVGERLAGSPAWWPLALVLAMPRLDAGQVGDVLAGADDPFFCDDDQFALLHQALGPARPDLAVRLLQSASRDGSPQRLLDGLDGVARARELILHLPTTVSSLELCVAESLAAPPPPGAAPVRRPASSRARQRRGIGGRSATRAPVPAAPAAAAPVRAPRAPAPQPPARSAAPSLQSWKSAGRFVHPPEWRRLDGATQGDVQLKLPQTPADLNLWGFELHNCLGSYRKPVDEGRSLVLGIFIRGRLGGAVEVDPAKRRIVQISATRSRSLPKAIREMVTAMLISRGAVARA